MNTYQLGKATNKAKEKYMDLSKSLCPEYRRNLVEIGRKHINDKYYARDIDKTNLAARDEQWFLDQLVFCDKKLEQISRTYIMSNKKRRKFEYWQNQRKRHVINLSILAYKNHCVHALNKINRIIYGDEAVIILEN